MKSAVQLEANRLYMERYRERQRAARPARVLSDDPKLVYKRVYAKARRLGLADPAAHAHAAAREASNG